MRFGDLGGAGTLSSLLHRAHRSRRHALTPASPRLELNAAISWTLGSIATSQARTHSNCSCATTAQNAAPPSPASNAWRAPSPRRALPRPRARACPDRTLPRHCVECCGAIVPSSPHHPHRRRSASAHLAGIHSLEGTATAFHSAFRLQAGSPAPSLGLALRSASTANNENRDRVSVRCPICPFAMLHSALTCPLCPATAMRLDARDSVGGTSWPRQR